MRKLFLPFISIALFAAVVLGFALFFAGNQVAVLSPEGSIAASQRELMVVTLLLMLIVVIPVFVMTFAFAWHYREGNSRAVYTPNWDHDRRLEAIWWGVPLAIIAVLGGIIWTSSHDLDPYRPIASDTEALEVQVVALQWKWLFIYPDYNIATVNYLHIPEKTPINLTLTADAPMNSFWIPQLGGQVYAMAGMSTQLHLIADKTGTYNGSSANLSGEGFAGMTFKAQSSGAEDFNGWVKAMQRSPDTLDSARYAELAKPSHDNRMLFFTAQQADLYDTILAKYMGHTHASENTYEGKHESGHN